MTEIEQICAELREMPAGASLSEESYVRVCTLAFGKPPVLYPIGLTFEEIGETAASMADQIEQRTTARVTKILTGGLDWSAILKRHIDKHGR